MRLTYEGVTREYDPQKMWVPESRLIKARLGWSPPAFLEALAEGDGDAVFMLWALACARAGEPLEDLDAAAETFNLLGLSTDDEPDESDEDPTTPAGEAGTTGSTQTG